MVLRPTSAWAGSGTSNIFRWSWIEIAGVDMVFSYAWNPGGAAIPPHRTGLSERAELMDYKLVKANGAKVTTAHDNMKWTNGGGLGILRDYGHPVSSWDIPLVKHQRSELLKEHILKCQSEFSHPAAYLWAEIYHRAANAHSNKFYQGESK